MIIIAKSLILRRAFFNLIYILLIYESFFRLIWDILLFKHLIIFLIAIDVLDVIIISLKYIIVIII
jgi:hypothetical protein